MAANTRLIRTNHHHTHSPKEEIKAADIGKEGQYQRTTGMNLLSFTTESMAGTRRGLRNLVSHLCKTFVCVLVLVATPRSIQAQTPDNLKQNAVEMSDSNELAPHFAPEIQPRSILP